MSETSVHPLVHLLTFYYENWEPEDDLPPLLFHQQHGLSIDVPIGWPYIEAIGVLVNKSLGLVGDTEHVIIIYPTSKIYRKIDKELGENVQITYFSWHEIYVAMDLASSDQRELSHFMELLGRSALTIFVGAPAGFPEVTNQVRRMCPGRLIILRTYEEKEK